MSVLARLLKAESYLQMVGSLKEVKKAFQTKKKKGKNYYKKKSYKAYQQGVFKL